MTQGEFDQLPLLLRYTQVAAVLEGMNKRALLESIGDGSLRHWPAAAAPRHRRYYVKMDVARMAGLQFRAPALHQLHRWLGREELLRRLGVGQRFFYEARRVGLLVCEETAHPPWRLRLLQVRAPPFLAPLQTGSPAVDVVTISTTHVRY